MCIILFAWQQHPDYPLVVAANRDEFHGRPAEPARWRGDICCGLDQRAGGTWLGVSRHGRFAGLTNFREPIADRAPGNRSRGYLPLEYLDSDLSPRDYLRRVKDDSDQYAGFNLLVGDREALWFYSNRSDDSAFAVPPGVHGLSNGLLDDPWPKVNRGREKLSQVLEQGVSDQALLAILQDHWRPEDADLPDTGVGLELERLVAPIFIQSEEYGTRASSAVLLPHSGTPELAEQRWGRDGKPAD